MRWSARSGPRAPVLGVDRGFKFARSQHKLIEHAGVEGDAAKRERDSARRRSLHNRRRLLRGRTTAYLMAPPLRLNRRRRSLIRLRGIDRRFVGVQHL